MINYVLGVLGIAISVLLFLIGYRQTIGAKKERITNANAQLEAILIRRTVLEKHTPSEVELTRLVAGKARDHNVRPEDLLSEGQLLNTVFTRVSESDLIPAEQRDEILGRITPTLAKWESGSAQHADEEPAEEPTVLRRPRLIYLWSYALAVSAVGGLVAAFPGLHALQTGTLRKSFLNTLPLWAATAAASLAMVTLAATFIRLRASQEEQTSKRTETSSPAVLEHDFRYLTKRAGATISQARHGSGFDYTVEAQGWRAAVALKNWGGLVMGVLVKMTARRLTFAMQNASIAEGLIVTRGPISFSSKVEMPENIQIMSLAGLRDYLNAKRRGDGDPRS